MNPAAEAHVVLTLVIPPDLEEALLETLLDHPDLAPGFTSQQLEGQGQQITFMGAAEHVRGRARLARAQVFRPRSLAAGKESSPHVRVRILGGSGLVGGHKGVCRTTVGAARRR